MDIANTLTSTRTTSSSANPQAKPVISSDFETFLKMLSTQLQNQDPLNPVDSADYAVQLATFSSVEQQVLTNNHLEELANQIQLSGMSDLAGWVGMEALSPAGAAFDGQPITVVPKVPAAADRAVLVVKDERGATVLREDLPLASAPFTWDGQTVTGGTAAYGSYTFELESSSDDNVLSIDPVPAYSRVEEARRSGGATVLMLSGGQTVAASDVIGLRR